MFCSSRSTTSSHMSLDFNGLDIQYPFNPSNMASRSYVCPSVHDPSLGCMHGMGCSMRCHMDYSLLGSIHHHPSSPRFTIYSAPLHTLPLPPVSRTCPLTSSSSPPLFFFVIESPYFPFLPLSLCLCHFVQLTPFWSVTRYKSFSSFCHCTSLFSLHFPAPPHSYPCSSTFVTPPPASSFLLDVFLPPLHRYTRATPHTHTTKHKL